MATEYDYIGRGELFAALLTNGVPGGYFSLGNCSKASFAIAEDSKELADYTSLGGGTKNKVTRIKSVELAVTAHDLSPDNLERALRGSSTVITSATVTDEVQTAYKGALVPYNYLPNVLKTITVKDSATGLITYTAGSDYIVKSSGIFIPATGSTIVDAEALKITYTKLASNVVEALTSAGTEYAIIFQGMNEAQSGKVVDIRAYRVKFSPTSGLDALSDDFNKLELKGTVLTDTTKIGTGISQYFKVSLASELSAA
jgi:hypothetical protein